MKIFSPLAFALSFLFVAISVSAAPPALTIYNQNFAVVRDTVSLDLKKGVNGVRFTETTAHLEPDSVILRDPTGKVNVQVLEQNYRNDPISQDLMLSIFEGKTIDFLVIEPDKPSTIVPGKIIRSNYAAHAQAAMQRYGQRYSAAQNSLAYGGGGLSQPIIEVDGKLRFSLPGQPLFPALGTDAILKPTIDWQINADKAAKLDAELCYITGGMSWEADYNVIAPEKSDVLDIVGWVTMDNQSGKTFENATIKLMAGEVSKIQEGQAQDRAMRNEELAMAAQAPPGTVTEKAFDEYHLYSLARPATLHDRETKQVEFIRASGVQSQKVFIYDGMKLGRWITYPMENRRNNEELGNESESKVAVVREFKNSEANRLGMPLPKGRVRFYRQDEGGQLEFTGENMIDHTPRDETLRIFTGNAFDLVGERKRTNYKADTSRRTTEESYEITLRNHKKEPVEIRVVEHLFRWYTWEITEKSDPFTKTNAQTIEFRIPLKPDEERAVRYTVRYTW